MPELPTVQVLASAERADQPVFYYDLGDPACYLAAERIMTALPVVPEWAPVLAAGITAAPPSADLEQVAERASELGLQAVRWPAGWPPDTRRAMLAATYAKRIGRVVAFSLAAFRQAFAGGRDLADPDTILIAGAACEMHPTALLKGMEMRSVAEALDRATAGLRGAGVSILPAVRVEERVFSGPDAISAATDILR